MTQNNVRARRGSAVIAVVAAVAIAPGAWAMTGATTHVVQPIAAATGAAHKTGPIFMPARPAGSTGNAHATATPPAPPCPESGKLPSPLSNCGLPELPATGQPLVGNMAYWGGHVQVKPRIYVVFWGWGRSGAFASSCRRERIVEGHAAVTVRCDPDGAGRRMADFVYQLGGTKWAGLQKQYYEKVRGRTVHITNPRDQLGGMWADDSTALNPTQTSPQLVYRSIALEAQRAMRHFHVKDLANANFVIAQPQQFSDPIAAKSGYCAFHDYTEPVLEQGWYDGITRGLSFTNMPYVVSRGIDCGRNSVNSGAAGTLDGVTIVLGHEIEETVTDPGAEDVLPDGTVLGGWFDPFDANENGDKCAWVGVTPIATGEPGSPGNIRGNHGAMFPVQSLWSNKAAEGLGYCAGAGTDLPVPNG